MVQRMNDVVQAAMAHDRQRVPPAQASSRHGKGAGKKKARVAPAKPPPTQSPAESTEEEEAKRLAQLASFQLATILHAMNAFPKLRRLTYSTCSIHAVENEDVVQAALAQQPTLPPRRPGDKPRPLFRAVAPKQLPAGLDSTTIQLENHLFGSGMCIFKIAINVCDSNVFV